MLIVRMEDEATDQLREAVRTGQIGGVILFPSEGADPAALGEQVATLRARRRAGRDAGAAGRDRPGGRRGQALPHPPARSLAGRDRARGRRRRRPPRAPRPAARCASSGSTSTWRRCSTFPAVEGAFIASRAYAERSRSGRRARRRVRDRAPGRGRRRDREALPGPRARDREHRPGPEHDRRLARRARPGAGAVRAAIERRVRAGDGLQRHLPGPRPRRARRRSRGR